MSDKRMSRVHSYGSGKQIVARVRRTRDALGDALVALIQEKPFDTITVKEVLARAGVSRSTFYAHFSDKEDLFMSDADEFFEFLATVLSKHGDKSDRVAPVKELFAHVGEMHEFFAALIASGKAHETLELAQGHFARGIERRLEELPKGQSIPAEQRPAIAFAHAGALTSLLRWWIDHGMRESPSVMDELYHRIVWNGGDFR